MPTPDSALGNRLNVMLSRLLWEDEYWAVMAVIAAARAAQSLIIEGGDAAATEERLSAALAEFDNLFPEITSGGDL